LHDDLRAEDPPLQMFVGHLCGVRMSKSYQIVEGSSNIQKMIIAQDGLGYRKANR
jgi:hypothetical protein